MCFRWGERYEEKQILGEGGSGIVYLAYDVIDAIEVAVKEYKKQYIAVQEIFILKKLEHLQIPRVLEVGKREERIFLVMSYIEGQSLQSLMERKGLKEKEKIVLGLQVCEIFSYLHSQNPPIIYRDLKPDNLIWTKEERVVLIDFGAAREYKRLQEEDTILLGTRGFAAPEQFGGRGQSDEKTDIYTIGRLLFVLFGEEELKKRNKSLCKKILYDIIKVCTQTERENRYDSVYEVWKALNRVRKIQQMYEKRNLFLGAIGILSLFFIFYPNLRFYLEETQIYRLRVQAEETKIQELQSFLETKRYFGRQEIFFHRKRLQESAAGGKEEEILLFLHKRLQTAKKIDWEDEELRELLFSLVRQSFGSMILDGRELLSEKEMEQYLEQSNLPIARAYGKVIKALWSTSFEEKEELKTALDDIWKFIQSITGGREKCKESMVLIELYKAFDLEEERGLELIGELQEEWVGFQEEETLRYQKNLYETAIQFLGKKEKTEEEEKQKGYVEKEIEYVKKLEYLGTREEQLEWSKYRLSLQEMMLMRGWVQGREYKEMKQKMEENYHFLLLKYPEDINLYLQYGFYLLRIKEEGEEAENILKKIIEMGGGEEEELFFLLQEELQEKRRDEGKTDS